jgi:phosphoribosylformylglycinamidine synthase subunit PurSL
VAGLDNFCWCDPVLSEKTPDGPYKMAQLVRANQALLDYCVPLNLPLISGKDSMKNDFYDGSTKISIPPTLLFSVIGTIPDIRNAVTMDFKRPGDIICLLGATKDELGGSEYLAMQGYTGNKVPKVNLASALARYKALHQAIMSGLVASCHDLSDGGLAVALAESAFSGGFGCRVELANVRFDGDQRYRTDEVLLFSESASRLLVTVHPAQWSAFEEVMAGTTFSQIGQVSDNDMVTIAGLEGKTVLQSGLDQMKTAWQRTLREL